MEENKKNKLILFIALVVIASALTALFVSYRSLERSRKTMDETQHKIDELNSYFKDAGIRD